MSKNYCTMIVFSIFRYTFRLFRLHSFFPFVVSQPFQHHNNSRFWRFRKNVFVAQALGFQQQNESSSFQLLKFNALSSLSGRKVCTPYVAWQTHRRPHNNEEFSKELFRCLLVFIHVLNPRKYMCKSLCKLSFLNDAKTLRLLHTRQIVLLDALLNFLWCFHKAFNLLAEFCRQQQVPHTAGCTALELQQQALAGHCDNGRRSRWVCMWLCVGAVFWGCGFFIEFQNR